ncbi:MAG: hypothetical protein PHP35_00040 [Candidatus Colwellbacteria bacterium]|nr:hypothetical protein [Candidatus Colwellbacteria bacterium]
MRRLIVIAVVVYSIVALSIKDSAPPDVFKAAAIVLFIGFAILLTSVRLAKKLFSKPNPGNRLMILTIIVYVTVAAVSGLFLVGETFMKSASYLAAGFTAFLIAAWFKRDDPPKTKKKGR